MALLYYFCQECSVISFLHFINDDKFILLVFINDNLARDLYKSLKIVGFDGRVILLFEVDLKVLIRVMLLLHWSSWAFSISSKILYVGELNCIKSIGVWAIDLYLLQKNWWICWWRIVLNGTDGPYNDINGRSTLVILLNLLKAFEQVTQSVYTKNVN